MPPGSRGRGPWLEERAPAGEAGQEASRDTGFWVRWGLRQAGARIERRPGVTLGTRSFGAARWVSCNHARDFRSQRLGRHLAALPVPRLCFCLVLGNTDQQNGRESPSASRVPSRGRAALGLGERPTASSHWPCRALAALSSGPRRTARPGWWLPSGAKDPRGPSELTPVGPA